MVRLKYENIELQKLVAALQAENQTLLKAQANRPQNNEAPNAQQPEEEVKNPFQEAQPKNTCPFGHEIRYKQYDMPN